jgi:hypothetical protein
MSSLLIVNVNILSVDHVVVTTARCTRCSGLIFSAGVSRSTRGSRLLVQRFS